MIEGRRTRGRTQARSASPAPSSPTYSCLKYQPRPTSCQPFLEMPDHGVDCLAPFRQMHVVPVCMRHRLEDEEIGVDAGPPEGTMHRGAQAQHRVACAGHQECGRKPAQVAPSRGNQRALDVRGADIGANFAERMVGREVTRERNAILGVRPGGTGSPRADRRLTRAASCRGRQRFGDEIGQRADPGHQKSAGQVQDGNVDGGHRPIVEDGDQVAFAGCLTEVPAIRRR